MITYFPLTAAINNDASVIITAIHQRANDVKDAVDRQSLTRRITLLALDLIGLAAGLVTIACLPVAAWMMALAPFALATVSLTTSITCLALSIFLHPRSRGESIVKDYWKLLFHALRKGDGVEIIQTCQELAKQEKQRAIHFHHCLNIKSIEGSPPFWKPFLHKTSLIGYLLMAIEDFRAGREETGQEHADQALSHYDPSGFPEEVKAYVKDLKDKHGGLRQVLQEHSAAKGVHSLDYLLFLSHEQKKSVS